MKTNRPAHATVPTDQEIAIARLERRVAEQAKRIDLLERMVTNLVALVFCDNETAGTQLLRELEDQLAEMPSH